MKNYSTIFCMALFLLPCSLQSSDAARDLTPEEYGPKKEVGDRDPRNAIYVQYYEFEGLPIETLAWFRAPKKLPVNAQGKDYTIVASRCGDGTIFKIPEDALAIEKLPKDCNDFMLFTVSKK